MSIRQGYKTKQRQIIEDCLKNNKNRHLTVEDIKRIIIVQKMSVGRTTIYRTLEKLFEEGKARKYTANRGDSACYQYADDTCCQHFHLKCASCGKIIHTECEKIPALYTHIFKEHKFKVDDTKTVIYGLCEDCSEE